MLVRALQIAPIALKFHNKTPEPRKHFHLYNNSDEHYQVHAGDKISQLVVIPVLYDDIHIMDSLDENTERGAQGFGSSGK